MIDADAEPVNCAYCGDSTVLIHHKGARARSEKVGGERLLECLQGLNGEMPPRGQWCTRPGRWRHNPIVDARKDCTSTSTRDITIEVQNQSLVESRLSCSIPLNPVLVVGCEEYAGHGAQVVVSPLGGGESNHVGDFGGSRQGKESEDSPRVSLGAGDRVTQFRSDERDDKLSVAAGYQIDAGEIEVEAQHLSDAENPGSAIDPLSILQPLRPENDGSCGCPARGHEGSVPIGQFGQLDQLVVDPEAWHGPMLVRPFQRRSVRCGNASGRGASAATPLPGDGARPGLNQGDPTCGA